MANQELNGKSTVELEMGGQERKNHNVIVAVLIPRLC